MVPSQDKVNFNENDLSYDDPLLSIQWEDNEVINNKIANQLVACNSQNVLVWDL